MAARIPMDGLNQLGGMVQARLCHPIDPGDFVPAFLRLLTQGRINMSLCLTHRLEGADFTCCVADTHESPLKRLAESVQDSGGKTEFHAPAGLLCMFPHRSSLKTLGLALTALSEARVPLYGFCSSLSALTFVIDQSRCAEAVSALSSCFEIPATRICFR
jgi:hypothetical protein